MRISTRVHGALDYLLGLALITAPWGLGFAGDIAAAPPISAGVAIIAYSLATDYEFGVLRRIQPPVHLWLDAIAGLMVAISPWVLGFDRDVWIPHLVAGSILLGVAAFTQTVPGYERRRDARPEAG